VEKRGKVGD